jgi:HPt (histidine-containing phosphotransfer) domain-containing protein
VEFAAHTLKGSLSHFGAEAAVRASRELEGMARRGELDGAEVAHAELTAAVEPLTAALERLLAS